MTSEIRTNSLTSRAGLSTVTLTDSGPMFSGITTFVDNSGFNIGTGSSIFSPATNTLTLGTNSLERFRINSNGNIGIAEDNPTRKLDVSGDVLGNAFMLRGNTTASPSIQAQMFRPENNTLAFATDGNNERLRIDSTGRVLVNTTSGFAGDNTMIIAGGSPNGTYVAYDGQLLLTGDETSGAADTGGCMQFYGHDGGSARGLGNIRCLLENGTSGNHASYMSFYTRTNASNPSERLRITSTGALGTNATVRAAAGGLDIQSQGATDLGTLTLGASGGQNGQNRNANTENQFRIMMPTYADPSKMATVLYGVSGSSGHDLHYGGGTGWAYATNSHRFFTTANQTTGNGTEILRINSSGHLNIPDASELRIGGNLSGTGDIVIQHNGSNSSITNNTGGFYVSGDGTDLHLRSAQHTTFSTGGSNERLRITSGGNVGIGVVGHDPLTLLHVQGANNGALKDVFTITNQTGSPGTEVGMVFECGADEVARISAKNEGSDVGPLIFSTASSQGANPTEKVRITSGGKVGIQTNNPQHELDLGGVALNQDDGTEYTLRIRSNNGKTAIRVGGGGGGSRVNLMRFDGDSNPGNGVGCSGDTNAGAYGGTLVYHGDRSGNENSFAVYMDQNANATQIEAFNIRQNGDYMHGGSSYSDRDQKENITAISGTALDKITQLSPKTWNWKPEYHDIPTDRTFAGFIAQEVQPHIPSIVTGTDGQGDMALDYQGLLAWTIKAVTELNSKVDTLEQENIALRARVTNLEGE